MRVVPPAPQGFRRAPLGSRPQHRVADNVLGKEHRWTYRGQVLPTDEKVEVEAVITELDDKARRVVATGYLTVDSRTIYQFEDFSLEIIRERE